MMLDRTQTLGEEIANSVSHGLGLLAAVAAFPILAIVTYQRGSVQELVAVSIFAITMVAMYLTSMLYHALPASRAKQVFQILDHAAIYLLIAGTYTPFTLGVLRGAWGWTLFGLIWSLAVCGVVFKILHGTKYPRASTWLYLAMGWLIVLAAKMAWELIPAWGLFWLAAGGLAYTVGTLFYAYGERFRYFHFIWHLFVMTGTVCHFIAVLYYSHSTNGLSVALLT